MLGMAAATWLAALAGRWFGWLGLLGLIPVAVTLIRRPDLAVIAVFLALAGWWSGHGSAIREAGWEPRQRNVFYQLVDEKPTAVGPVGGTRSRQLPVLN